MTIKTKLSSVLKKILQGTGINTLAIKFFDYVFCRYLAENPNFFNALKERQDNGDHAAIYTKVKGLGDSVIFGANINISDPLGIVVGNNVNIGENGYFLSRGGIYIGDNVHIANNVKVYSSEPATEDGLPVSVSDKPVFIGRNVVIGVGVSIMPGVRIGDGAIIGSGVTVSGDIADNSIVGLPTSMDASKSVVPRDRLMSSTAGKKETAVAKAEKIFFVLGTGRSGSTTISRILSSHSEISCFHEPKLQLIRLSTDYLYGKVSDDLVKEELGALFRDAKIHPAGYYGESDQKLVPLIGFISQILPQAKFIWLIRNAKDTVNSTYSRGWFSDKELGFSDINKSEYELYRGIYSDYRPQADKIGLMPHDEWRSMSHFERNCWYWAYWNGLIKSELAKLDSRRSIKVALEEMDERLPEMLEFIGVGHEDLKTTTSNVAESRHKLRTEDDWTDEMRNAFNKWCLRKL